MESEMKKTDKKPNSVKNAQKTQKKPRGKPFTKENQPEKKGRPAGVKDFATYLKEVSNGEGKKELVKQVWIGIQEGRADMIKIALEYIFEKPKQTVENINHEPLKVIVESPELADKISKIKDKK
jgi:hypothetical protein